MVDGWLLDTAVVLLSVTAVLALPRPTRSRLCIAFARLSWRNRVVSLLGPAVLALTVRLLCLPLLPPPQPLIADEQSYLLLAKTLAMGRLSNPPHPMWRHFETLFVLQLPSYSSVYPPLQGIVLAAGALAFGHPWAGVLLSVALLCVAVVWMLRAYVTRAWAMYGGLLAAAGYGILSYWTNSYWGGAGAALGGALIFGALPRMLAGTRTYDGALLAFGLVLVANSRPYEGFLACLPVAFAVIWHLLQTPGAFRRQFLALAATLLAGAGFTLLYNRSVTGNPLRLPHSEYIRQYAVAPAFVWERPRDAPAYGDRVLRDAHLSFAIDYAEYTTVYGAARMTFRKLSRLIAFYWGPFWAIVLLSSPELFRIRRLMIPFVSLALCLAGVVCTVGFQPHYAAPCTSIFVLLLVESLRRLRMQWKHIGIVLLLSAPLAWTGFGAIRAYPRHSSLAMRPSVAAKLLEEPGRHVVFIRYSAGHPLSDEWVYNEPNIDQSRLIWARERGAEENRTLMQYYPGRQFWLLEPDEPNPRLTRCTQDCPVPDSESKDPGRIFDH